MSVIDAVNIDHGNNHEDKHFSEEIGSEVFFIGQKIDDSFHGKWSWSLSRMHSGRYQHYRFVEFERSFELWKDEIVEKFLICIILIFMVMGGNGEQMNIPPLWTFD